MTTNKKSNEVIEKETEGVEVLKEQNSEVEALSGLLKNITEPMANSQVVAAKEATKQTKIIADTTRTVFRGLIGVAFAVIILAGVALVMKETQVTEKIVIALLGFLGGFGLGKSSGK